MLTANNLSVEFSARPLFSGVSFVVNPRDRIALVGKNGAGKSTLLKILSGESNPSSGVVSRPTDTTVGYLPQVMQLADTRSVIAEAETAFADLQRLKQRVADAEREIATRTDYDTPAYAALVER